jgi:predicted PurR-regulated permease PerM
MIDEQVKSRKIRRWFVYGISTFLGVFAVGGILYGLKPLLLPFILGAFLAYLFKPLAKSFQGDHWTKYIRLTLFIVGIVFTLSAIGKGIKDSMPSEKELLTLKVRVQYRLNERFNSWMGLDVNEKGNFIFQNIGADLEAFRLQAVQFIKLNEDEQKLFLMYRKGYKDEAPIAEVYYKYYLKNIKANIADIEKIQAREAESSQASVTAVEKNSGSHESKLSTLLHTLTNWIIFPLVFMFILTDKGQILHFFMRLIPNRYFELTYSVVENVDEALGKYIRGTMLECVLVGITLIIGFYACGMELKFALLIGALGGITNAIPFVGTLIACVIGATYALIAENVHSFIPFINENNLMIAVILVVLFAHLLDNAIYQPLVVGGAVSLHPLVVIMGVFGGSIMFGFAGLILAIPTIVIVTVVTKTFFSGLKDYNIV